MRVRTKQGAGKQPVRLKSLEQIEVMREGGRILAATLAAVGQVVRPGVTTGDLDRVAAEALREAGARASFLGLYEFPASTCVGVNDVVVHGVPSDGVRLVEGDIVGVDIGVEWRSMHVDAATTFPVGTISKRVRKLIEATRKSLDLAVAACQVGNRVGDISQAVQEYIEGRCGYSCVRQLCGHGVGFAIHEEPQVPNHVSGNRGPLLVPGMTLAIEPMVNMGSFEVYTDDDGWAVRAKDGKLSAHFEHTVAVTDNGPVVLTLP